MISLRKNFLFVHIPKTAGNSLQNVLRRYSEDIIVAQEEYQDGVERFEVRNRGYEISKHATLEQYKSALEPAIYNSLFKFSTIRNPWDRMISYYFSPHRGVRSWDRDEFIRLVDQLPSASYYLCLGDKKRIGFHFDFLLRFENLEQDFKQLAKLVDIDAETLAVRNASLHQHYSHYYDEEIVQMVGNKFADEIELGGYQFKTA